MKTKALIERQVCHQGAQASMKSGSFCARASPRAFGVVVDDERQGLVEVLGAPRDGGGRE